MRNKNESRAEEGRLFPPQGAGGPRKKHRPGTVPSMGTGRTKSRAPNRPRGGGWSLFLVGKSAAGKGEGGHVSGNNRAKGRETHGLCNRPRGEAQVHWRKGKKGQVFRGATKQ